MNERPAIRHLRMAGWTPGRHVDIAHDLQVLQREGYTTFPAVIEFLHEYSGLRIPTDHGPGGEIWLSTERGCSQIFSEWTRDYSRRAGLSLLPVGYRSHLTLLIGEDGRWFGGFDDEFGLIGENVLNALDNEILREGFVQRL